MKIASKNTTHKSNSRRFSEPPIGLVRQEKPQFKRGEGLSFKLRSNPTDANSETHELRVMPFSTGTPETWIRFRKDLDKIVVGQNVTTGPGKYGMARRLLDGDALAAFDSAAQESGTETNEHFTAVLEKMATHIFPKRALAMQRRYMRRFMRKPHDMRMREFLARLNELNGYLPYFPDGTEASKLPDDELIDIGEYACPASWQKQMFLQGFDPLEHTLLDFLDFLSVICHEVTCRLAVSKSRHSRHVVTFRQHVI